LLIVVAAVLVAAAVGTTIALTGHGSSPTAQTDSHSLASSWRIQAVSATMAAS
jgi:fructoselysine-6-P-deglycase FrlB-like protein